MALNPQASQSGNKVTTGKVRISFPVLFKARQQRNDAGEPQGDPKFSLLLLIPKENDGGTLAAMREAQKVALASFKERFGKNAPRDYDTIHDCDEEDDLEAYPERAGHYRVNVSSKRAPGVVDVLKRPITDETEVYSGAYVRVSLDCYPYSGQQNKGVTFGLNHVQKLEDGEALGGVATSAEDAFDDLDVDLSGDLDDIV
jgi:hypothetical protein